MEKLNREEKCIIYTYTQNGNMHDILKLVSYISVDHSPPN